MIFSSLFLPPEKPSVPRRILLAPLALAYAAGSRLHGRFMLRSRVHERDPLLPLIVIGALRAGGSGKTPVALELARALGQAGLRVGILAYRIGGGKKAAVMETVPGSDWGTCSDEAVLMARAGVARVFTTRDREAAWNVLSHTSGLDVLISDDGLTDPRLRGAFRVALRGPDENPGVWDLLPAGPYRSTTKILDDVDFVLAGPLPGAPGPAGFQRETILPADHDPAKTYWALCGLGNPAAFARDLERAGVRLAGLSAGRDHQLPDVAEAARRAREAGAAAFICSAKDAVKLAENEAAGLPVAIAGERLTLGAGFLAAVSSHLSRFASARHLGRLGTS